MERRRARKHHQAQRTSDKYRPAEHRWHNAHSWDRLAAGVHQHPLRQRVDRHIRGSCKTEWGAGPTSPRAHGSRPYLTCGLRPAPGSVWTGPIQSGQCQRHIRCPPHGTKKASRARHRHWHRTSGRGVDRRAGDGLAARHGGKLSAGYSDRY